MGKDIQALSLCSPSQWMDAHWPLEPKVRSSCGTLPLLNVSDLFLTRAQWSLCSLCRPHLPSLTGTDGSQLESWWLCRRELSREGSSLAAFSDEKICREGTGMRRLFQEVDKLILKRLES